MRNSDTLASNVLEVSTLPYAILLLVDAELPTMHYCNL
jgi:hypothetical protein